MLCAKCNYDNPADALFCMKCGTRTENRCASCDTVNPVDANFCRKCGEALGTATAASPPLPAAAATTPRVQVTDERQTAEGLDGERKTVTALFADIKGSTELMRDLDPEDARAIVDPALKLMIDAVHQFDGYVVQSTGDGIFALFGAPVAHEDHPQRAVRAALAMREGLRRQGAELRSKGGAGLGVRIGINTGEVVMRSVQTGGHTEYSPIGHAINVASRMETAAPADRIVVSAETRRLVEGYFELRGLGPTEIKGIAKPIEVFEVVATGALHGHFDIAAKRGLTKFVGRESELEQVQSALGLAQAGHGQIVSVMAEAGTGKSRLVYEFKATIPASCKVLEAYSVSHGKASAWLPVLELLRDYFGIADGDDVAARREKVRATLDGLDPALQDATPHLFGLLGIVEGPDPLAQMDPQVKRQRALDAIRRIVLRESLNQPLVVIFEDLHWIDEQTQALLNALADSIAEARVLLLVNYRPEYPDRWGDNTYYSQIRLEPLAGANGAAMLASLLGESVELNPLKRLVIERTGGNPFFIEEIVQSLFDEGALVGNGTVKVTRSLSQLRLPPTVQGVLAARIDRQPGGHKQLLQTLAVIGRESSLGLLTQLAMYPNTELAQMLSELRAAEFIYEQASAGSIEYVFKHALTQEVAYNSLLIERRKQLHERAGQALEEIFAAQLDDHLTQLAHHYGNSDNVEKAIEYLGRAGQQAMERSAYADAISNLSAAIDLLQRLPDGLERIRRELSLQLTLGPASIAIEGYAAVSVERAFTRARELCERLDNPPELSPILYGLWGVHYLRGDNGVAYEHAEQLLRRAQGAEDATLLISARCALGDALCSMGEFPRAREQLEIADSLYDRWHRDNPSGGSLDPILNIDYGVHCLSYEALTSWCLGYAGQALSQSNEALALAESLAHPHTLAFAEFFASRVRQLRRDAQATREMDERLIALSTEHGFTFWLAQANIEHGGVIVKCCGSAGHDQAASLG